MSFSMLFCIVFTMGAVFFDCKWEKVPNLWIIAGLQISMAEHLSGEVIQGLGSAVIRFWGGIFLVFLLFFRCDWRQRFLYFFQYLQRAYVERSLPPYLVPGKRPENIHFTIPILGSVLLLYLGG